MKRLISISHYCRSLMLLIFFNFLFSNVPERLPAEKSYRLQKKNFLSECCKYSENRLVKNHLMIEIIYLALFISQRGSILI